MSNVVNIDDLEFVTNRFLAAFNLHGHASTIFDRAIHQGVALDEAIQKTMELKDVQVYWRIVGEEKKQPWEDAQRKKVVDWLASEKQRKESVEANRLLVADKLSKIDFKLLSLKTLYELIKMAEKELAEEDKPK